MKIAQGHSGATPLTTNDVTGALRLDPVIAEAAVRASHAVFEPGARNHWHRHETAQLIVMGTGVGILAGRDGEVHKLLPGDVAYTGPGEEHWHGAAPDSFLTYFVVSLGLTEMLGQEVTDEEYEAAWAQIAEQD